MRSRRHNRSGQALVEFGLVALVLYMLVGGAITFGIWIYAAGQIQQAANVGARELSQTPLPFDETFENALEQKIVRQRVYDDRWLVIDLTKLKEEKPNHNFFTYVVPQMPLLNQQLAVLYIRDDIPDETVPGGRRHLMRYPGALLKRSEGEPDESGIEYPDYVADDYFVQIPLVIERKEGHNNGGGAERIRWVGVVEEVDDPDTNPEPFSLENANLDMRGVVALRVHYPAQSTWLSSYQDRGAFVPNGGDPNVANDDAVEPLNPEAMKGTLLDSKPLVFENSLGESVYAGTYGGKYGLGIHGAMTSPELTGDAIGIRPYRRVLVSHAIFRREVFLPSIEDSEETLTP
ncbi:TadE/TadG family type IV pilus assembly protein [Rhodopirellula baltica]|uniref:TadE family protein n=1 Tax=Rhodopirellula baltica WH47 TaxID=991778 RepID=F2B019_RHOBT|nr:TadE/TadG family type IV pilus assembly protein [Rhodopirellula baltica]EGF24772.1 TadE family protein [Rhodopirellula baltica WH47]